MTRVPFRRSWVWLAGALALSRPPLLAQGVDARVVRASDSAAVVGALVRLLDASGARVAQATTLRGGVVALRAPAAGRYTVAVLRVGQRPWRSAALTLDSGAARRVTFRIPDEPIVLDAIAVESRSACRASPGEGSIVADLLTQADRALTVTRLEMEFREVGYFVELYRRTITLEGATVDSSTTVESNLSWPIRSVSPEELAAHGFVRQDAPTRDRPLGGQTYFGPDAPVLLSPWFLSSHCFGLARGSGADSGTVMVTFRPESPRHADITGRIVLTALTFELRRIEWRYVGLPHWVTREGAAGEMVFRRLPSGVYLPTRWWMRAPVPEANLARQPVRLWGWRESGGWMLLSR